MDGNWLILETSGRVGQVGLARHGTVVRSVALDDSRRHARDLAPVIDEVLKAEELVPANLTGIMVGRGPGSYTGLRVGLMSAKALAYSLGCELRGVDTFAAIARQSPAEVGRVWVIADALQGQVYAQPFVRDSVGWVAARELRIVPRGVWIEGIQPGDCVSGPGVIAYRDRLPQGCPLVPEPEWLPRVESVYSVGRNLRSLSRSELFALEPLYLRGSSAEEKRK